LDIYQQTIELSTSDSTIEIRYDIIDIYKDKQTSQLLVTPVISIVLLREETGYQNDTTKFNMKYVKIF